MAKFKYSFKLVNDSDSQIGRVAWVKGNGSNTFYPFIIIRGWDDVRVLMKTDTYARNQDEETCYPDDEYSVKVEPVSKLYTREVPAGGRSWS